MSLVIVGVTGAAVVQSGAPPATDGPQVAAGRTVAARVSTTAPVDGPVEQTVTIDGLAYPNPLRLDNGDPVATAAEWEGTRRAELLAAFRQNVYGQGLPDTRRRPSRSRRPTSQGPPARSSRSPSRARRGAAAST